MDDIAYLVSIQPVVISYILIVVSINITLTLIDFILSATCPKWHSPNGFFIRNRGDHENKTK